MVSSRNQAIYHTFIPGVFYWPCHSHGKDAAQYSGGAVFYSASHAGHSGSVISTADIIPFVCAECMFLARI